MTPQINHILCNLVVEYIKRNNRDMFDAADLEDDFDHVLKQCGWNLSLTDEEKKQIYSDLYDIGLSNEISEVSAKVFGDFYDNIFEGVI